MRKAIVFLFLSMSGLCATSAAVLESANVKTISLLVIDAGQELEGRYGHVALRITSNHAAQNDFRDTVITFDPGIPVGHHAPMELFIHGVGVGFNTLYPSVVSAVSYGAFRQQYVHIGRGLSTYPIELKPEQKTKVLAFLNHEVKTGHGRRPFQIVYYNCAIMAVEAINSGLQNKIPNTSQVRFPLLLPAIFREQHLISARVYDPPLN